jgi:glycosyltransferase involved in cell wall biosynthesis
MMLFASRFSLNETLSFLEREGIPSPPKTRVCHHGFDFEATALSSHLDADRERLDAFRRARRVVVLMVGTIEPKKNHLVALHALKQMASAGEDLGLVVLGRDGWLAGEIVDELTRAEGAHPEHLLWLRRASDETLAAAYAICDAALILSDAEGFGLPLIEALGKGRPVICSDIAVFREIADGSAYFVPPRDHLALIVALKRICHDPTWSVELAAKAARFAWPTWQETVDRVLDDLAVEFWSGRRSLNADVAGRSVAEPHR